MPMRPTLLAFPLLFSLVQAASFPPTPAKPVTDVYHGVSVVDPYRWLENWDDPAVKAWSEAQNAAAREALDHLPSVDKIRARVTEILSAQSISFGNVTFAGGTVFALKRQPPKQQAFLVVMESPLRPEAARSLVDPNQMNTKGTTTIDWFVPSPDGKLVAVSLSEGGSESGDVQVFEVATGKSVFEKIPRVHGGTGGGSLAWLPDGKSFFYTRYPRGNERPPEDSGFYLQLYRHVLGTPTEQDAYEIGRDFPKIAEIIVETTPAGLALVSMQKGDGGEFQHYVRSVDGNWHQLTQYTDRAVQMVPGRATGSSTPLYFVSRLNAPHGKLLQLTFNHRTGGKFADAKVLLTENADTLVSVFGNNPGNIVPTDGRLYVTYQLGGPSEVRVFDLEGRRQGAPEQFPVGSVGDIVRVGDHGDAVLFDDVSYINPPAMMLFDPAAGTTTKTAMSPTSPVNYADCEVVREAAISKDGTRIPVNIIRRKGLKLDGAHPCLVTGYGGFNISREPRFSAARRVLIEQGFVFAEVNLRGGGEFGDEWHSQGALTKKQNVFDDFAAACQHMIDAGYTRSEKLAIEGGSNGGLLMGATLTQHPSLMRCVVSHVGIYDMLRVELSSNGSFNIPEFGTVKDEAQFRALYAYSPYYHVKEGVKYPAILFLTGANDPRVDPLQSRKMTARLQAVGATCYLRTSANSGHGIGSSLQQRIEEAVDVDAFLFAQLGVTYGG
jgi:prolyl oligopeptidase